MEGLLPNINLGDKRLDRRCLKLIDQFVKSPASSIPQACLSWKDTKAAYRFFENEAVDPDQVLSAHYVHTKQLIAQTEGVILVAQDTTDCDYSTHKQTRNLGYLQGQKLFGIKLHSALAISESGTPLGLLHQKRWIRNITDLGKRRMRAKWKDAPKESIRWIETFEAVARSVSDNQQVIVIGDRESDLFELFKTQTRPNNSNIHLLVRAKHNRYLAQEQGRLFDQVEGLKAAGEVTLDLERNPRRKARQANLKVAFSPVSLLSSDQKSEVKLSVVCATEINPPKGESPINWLLLATWPVTSFDEALKMLDFYTKRWLIERFHYCLKSGCGIEELQLQEESRLERALAVYSVVAWQLLWLTYEAREHPNASFESILSAEEWRVLCLTHKQSKQQQPEPTIHEAVRLIAKLGGFLARKGDKEPGVKTLWIGLRRFHGIMFAWQLFKDQTKDVGKG